MSLRPRTHPSRRRLPRGVWVLLISGWLCSPARVEADRADAGQSTSRDAGAPADAAAPADVAAPADAVAPADAADSSKAASPVASQPRSSTDALAARLGLPADAPTETDADEASEDGSERSTTDLKYLLERVEVAGNHNTKERLIKKFVPLEIGSAFKVSDPEIEALRYRLLGTGWYDRVDLRLKRGKRPGWVVLIIEVEERRTLVFQQLAVGLGWSVEQARKPNEPPSRKARPYLGLAIADTNFLGTGKTLGGEVLVSPDQQGVAIGYADPVVRSSRWGFRTRATFVNGQEYFGGDKGVQVSTYCPDELTPRAQESCMTNSQAAVVDYWRTGLTVGTARDVGSFTRLTLDWRGDFVSIPSWGLPDAAKEQRGRAGPDGDTKQTIRAIDFAIEPGNSFVSMLSVGFTYDKRDSAILPSRGTLASFMGDLASPLIGSYYQFVRLQTSLNGWFPLKWGHTIRTGLWAGAVFGYAPFFYKFFVTDLTDLQPSRIMGLNLDHRPAPNLFGVFQCGKAFDASCGTAVAQMRQEELAARVDAEYIWPLVRGRHKFVKGADAYFLVGLYGLADPRDLQVAMPGYNGIARLPIDLTLDAGVRLDTQIGVFQIGLAKLFWGPVQK